MVIFKVVEFYKDLTYCKVCGRIKNDNKAERRTF